ncbi:hypothetical protein DV735_g4007, partial [Chaetothyriales sp. CBS 134920]
MINSSWPSRILQLGVIGAGTSVAAFFVLTKHCEIVEPLDPQDEALFQSPWYRLYNPRNNRPMSDACVRKIPLRLLRYDLLVDAKSGGSKLVEAFAQGCFGSNSFTIQRLIHKYGLSQEERERLLPSLPTVDTTITPPAPSSLTSQSQSPSIYSRLATIWRSSAPPASTGSTPEAAAAPSTSSPAPQHLWTQSQLLRSHYTPGTIVANHFLVLSHTPTSILVRCGASPFDSPSSPRPSDGLFEFSAVPNFDKGYVEFRMTSLFYDGQAEEWPEDKEVMGGGGKWLHQQYAKLWMENAVRNCRMSKFRSHRSQIAMAKEKMAKETEEER